MNKHDQSALGHTNENLHGNHHRTGKSGEINEPKLSVATDQLSHMFAFNCLRKIKAVLYQ